MKKILVLLVLIATTILSGTATHKQHYPDNIGLDSVRVLKYRSGTLYDSISDSINTFPFTGYITIDDKRQWRLEYYRYWGGETIPTYSSEVVWGTAGALSPASPSGTSQCTVYGKVYDDQENPVAGAALLFDMGKNKLVDTCNDVTIIPFPRTAETDDTGYFSIQLLKSGCVGDVAYKVSISITNEYGTALREDETLKIPMDSTTYLLKY